VEGGEGDGVEVDGEGAGLLAALGAEADGGLVVVVSLALKKVCMR
jgi:hypothetical protein